MYNPSIQLMEYNNYKYIMTNCGHLEVIVIVPLLGRRWIQQMLCGVCLFPGMIGGVALLVNVVAMFYHASRAIPITSMVTIATVMHYS